MKKHFNLIGILTLCLLGMASCDVINPDEEIPTYISVESFDLEVPDQTVYGADSHNITDVWLFSDDILVGVFELPAQIPVLAEGPTNIKALPGIKVNGIGNDRAVYPFYDFYEIDLTLVPEAVSSISPTVQYVDASLYIEHESFESGGLSIIRSIGSDTALTRIPNPFPEIAYLNDNIGEVVVDSERPFFKIETDLDLDLAFSNPIFLEFDYRTDMTFIVGLKSVAPSLSEFGLIGLNPKLDEDGNPSWNKVYVDLSAAASLIGNGTEMEVIFSGLVANETGFLQLDNIKIIKPG